MIVVIIYSSLKLQLETLQFKKLKNIENHYIYFQKDIDIK